MLGLASRLELASFFLASLRRCVLVCITYTNNERRSNGNGCSCDDVCSVLTYLRRYLGRYRMYVYTYVCIIHGRYDMLLYVAVLYSNSIFGIRAHSTTVRIMTFIAVIIHAI